MATGAKATDRQNEKNFFPDFLKDSRSVGILLLACTGASLFITNHALGQAWQRFWAREIPAFETLHLPHSYLHVINDALMSVFFFLAGMEIKRELLQGELSTVRKAALPAVAAIGGMVIPAIIFSLINRGTGEIAGWAIPSATDIAFSLGVASLLGKKAPASLKIFLTALAIIDDLGAIVIIACFYGTSIHFLFLLGAGAIVLLLYLANKHLNKFGIIQILLGFGLWYCIYNSGIHPTVAGVIFGFFVPVGLLAGFEQRLHKTVYFFIMPVFALANTAIVFPNNILGTLNSRLSLGIILGLFIGKPLGIFISSYCLVRSNKAVLPTGINWSHITGAGLLAGIGFTMSIFISSLAFQDIETQDIAKIAVLAGSALSMIAGFILLRSNKSTETS